MKLLIMVSLFFVAPVHCFYRTVHTFELMDQLFAEMAEKTRTHQIDVHDWEISCRQDGESIDVWLAVPSETSSRDISIQVEEDILYITVTVNNDRADIKIRDQILVLSTTTKTVRELKDDQGNTVSISSGSTHSSQKLNLSAKIDLQRVVPKADLDENVLKITLGVKSATKIPVTTSGGSVRCGSETCNCGDRPINPIDNETHREIKGDVGCDVFKENVEK